MTTFANSQRVLAVCWMTVWLLCAPAAALFAQSGGADQATEQRAQEHVQTAREVLDGGVIGGGHPWYDGETDDATLIPLKAPQQASTGPPWYQFIIDFFSWLTNTGISFTFNGRQYKISLLMILVTLIILAPILWLLWKLYKNHKNSENTSSSSASLADRTDAERVEALPFDIEPADNLLDVARKFADVGRYADAIIYLFSHQLVELDRAQMIHLTKGKTNRQYLRELRAARLRSLMEHSTVAFEDAFFGHYEINKARFEECWSRLDEFRSLTGGRGIA